MSKKEVELMREVVPEEQKMYFDALAELDYEFYVEYVNEGYHHGKHTQYICNKLQEAIEEKGAKRLIVTMPPQHSKSFTITETFPSFFLGRNPTKNVIGVGYSDDFAEKFGRRNKEKIKDFGAEIFDVHLSSKQAHKDWELEKGGGMISSGVGGQITGKRADCLPAGTKIETEIGKLDIDKLVNMEDKPKVLSYNHEIGELAYKEMVAYLEKDSNTILEIKTDRGHKIRTTDDHKFFVINKGYIRAGELKLEDTLLNISNEESEMSKAKINKIKKLDDKEVKVYDIQVEGTNNFFAEEILVHNCMIIDDPIKNRKEANSKRYRDTLWEEWESTLSTRLAEDAIVILVLTRWHEDDLAGRFLERFGDDWELLNFPALSEGKDTDLLNRPEDTALWEDQYSTEYLKKRRKELSAKAWNSLYMGNPNIEEGNQFKSTYFRYFRENDDRNAFILERPEGKKVILKEKCVCFQTVDSSFKVKTRNDYTVISTWYLTPNNDLLLYDVYRDKISVPDLWATLSNVMDRFNPSKVFVEDRASGTGLIQTAKREGRPVIPIPAESDKITRSFNISTFYENRAVYHKAETNWVADFEDELNTFPEGTNDDQVDTASIAGIVVSRGMIRTSSGNRGFVHTT